MTFIDSKATAWWPRCKSFIPVNLMTRLSDALRGRPTVPIEETRQTRACNAVATGFLASGRYYATFPRQRPASTRTDSTRLRLARLARLASAASILSLMRRVDSSTIAWNFWMASCVSPLGSVSSTWFSDGHSAPGGACCAGLAGPASSWHGGHSAVQPPTTGRGMRLDYRTPIRERSTFTWPTGPADSAAAACPACGRCAVPPPAAPT